MVELEIALIAGRREFLTVAGGSSSRWPAGVPHGGRRELLTVADGSSSRWAAGGPHSGRREILTSTGKVVTANGGREYPAITDARGDFQLFLNRHGLVLGGMEGMRYAECQFTMQPGGKLFVYTDGLPEATNVEGAMFGTDERRKRMTQIKDRPHA